MRSRFDEQLELLNNKMIQMGAKCENIIALSAKLLFEGDRNSVEDIAAIGSEIDNMESEIEAICLKLLLQQQPVARDLRQISAALKMITDMERIGDQAEDIAEITEYLGGRTVAEHLEIRKMAEATIKMVTDSVNSFVEQDLRLAQSVLDYDDVVDNYFSSIKQKLIGMISENTADGEVAVDILMIAKYFERIGDHATNIAEWVVFSLTGVHKG